MAELQLDPKKTALVLIDLQNSAIGVNTAPYAVAQVVVNSKKLAEAFRAAGAPVIYVNVDFNGFLKPPADQPFNMGDKPIPAAASQIAPSAGFQPGDLLVTKRHWGAFAGTDLEQQLKTRGVDTVVLTARQGIGLGFAFVLVEDACAGLDAEEHRFAFEKIFPRLARIRATSEVIASLA
jgi:nicotinamidase-related amidase